ncbi:MAG: VWA domain-containing protein [Aliarcobacter sp.]|nr:VWA domain-containing protein [Aliarcobacter sp.]
MKLTIKTENGQKIVDLKNDLQFNTLKGEQYVFSNGFSNYVLNFKDNQESVVLTFNVDGKSIKVELTGIVPLLQSNTTNMSNPTAIIINKDVNNKDVDNIVDNNSFNGGEIIDRLEALISKPVELGDNKATNLTLISDYQTLLESLGAAAAGGQAGGNTTANGSTFNSIFSIVDGGLNGIADTARGVNLTESISTIPVDTGNTTVIAQSIVTSTNVNVNLIGVNTNVIEGENATYRVTLTDDAGNSVIAVEDITVTFKYTYISADGTDITETINVVIPAGSSEAPVLVKTIDDNLSEGKETFSIEIDTVLNQTQFDSVTVNKTPVETTITDEIVPTTPDAQTALVSITGPADVIEGDTTTPYTVSISQAPTTDLTVSFTYTGVAADGTDFTGVSSVVIKAGTTSTTFTIATIDDNLAEGAEKFTVSINPSSLGKVGGLEDVRVSTVNNSVETTITDETDDKKDNVNVKLVGIDTAVIEGENATYKVTLTDDFGKPVLATQDMEVTFTYTYTTAEGNDITETATVTIKAGTSEAPVSVKTIDDNIYEISEEFTIAINTVSNQTQFENVIVNKTPVVTIINDEDRTTPDDKDGDKPILIITGSTVTEKVNGVSTGDKVVGTVEISIENGKVFAEDLMITLSNGKEVVIKAGETTTGPIEIETNRIDDYYKQGTTTYDVSIQNVSNSKIDITNKIASITINDDVDPVDVIISATVTTPKIIDVTTATDGTTGVKITGFNSDGTQVNLSIITNSDHNGFGIDGKNLSNGDSKELGVGEKIVVEFTDGKDVNSLDVSFAWRNNHETAKLTFIKDGQIVGYAKVTGDGSSTTKAIVTYYDENNNLIKTVNAKGSSDKVDEAFTFELPDANGGIVSFDKVEFSAPTNVDDYLINKIVYKEVINSEVTNVLTDDAKVTFNIQLDENYPPQGTATVKIEVNGVIYDNVIINATGRATLTVDGKDLGDLSKVVVKVLEINGGNYEKVNLVEKTFDFTPVLKSSDDSITTNEDETYTLKVTDFGEVSINTTIFKITELPTNGKLFLTITMGDTIFNPDGTQTVATQNTKVEVTKDQIISLAQIGAKKVEFVPNKDSDIDGSFKFEVGDGTKFSGEYTTAIEVVAVADKPTASIDVTKIVSSIADDIIVKVGNNTYNITEILANKNDSTQFKQKSNVGNNYDMDNDNTTKITVNGGLNQNDLVGGTLNDDIIIINGDVKSGTNINSTDGNDIVAILGNIYGGSFTGDNGTDYLYLGKGMNKYEILNYNGYEQGHPDMDFQLKDKDTGGILVVNNIEGIIFADGNTFGKVNVVNNTTVEYNVNVGAALADTDGSETLTVKISGVPTGATFDTVNIVDKGNGVWELTLPAGTKSISDTLKMTVPESAQDFNLTITARATETNDNSNGLNFAEATSSDAIVYSINETNTLAFGKTTTTTNIVITLDISKSMDDQVDGSKTRLDIAKAAIKNMLDSYSAQGTVNVKLITFSTEGHAYDTWMTLTEAKNTISSLRSDMYTNYEDAVYETYHNYTEPAADKTIAYFISDGVPTAENNEGKDVYKNIGTDAENGWLDTAYKTSWNNFIATNVDELYVVGVGSGITDYTYLNLLANAGDNAVVKVTDDTKLNAALQELITHTISGDVSDNISGGDGTITINSIVVDGVEYTKTTFPTDGIPLDGDGKLVFDFETGVYSYSAKSSEFTTDTTKTFEVHASDTNGDSSSFDVNLKMDISPNESVNTLNLSGEDIDLTSIISSHTNTDVINLENSKVDKISIDLNDVLVQEDHQLMIKGDLHDKVDLDTPSDWASAGHEQVDGVNYNVYTGTGVNSTIKLLIDDDIDVTPHI